MNFARPTIITAFLLLLTACAVAPDNNNDSNTDVSSSSLSSVSSVSSAKIEQTDNVSYKGTVQPAGISIYMEGTHRLELDSEKFILLESDDVDLNGYVGEEVEVHGSVRPTVEADAVIMNVNRITLESKSSDASSSSSLSSDSVHLPESSAPAVSEAAVSSEEHEESSVSSVVKTSSSSDAVLQHSEEFDARIEAMAEVDASASEWTQQYCTGHIGFCVPVHKNWWFQSFGATASDFWHVEMNSEPLDKIHDGPIAIRLTSGSMASLNASDGQVVRSGNKVTGYRAWTDDRHFEVTADARLEAAVRYIVENLETYEEEE